MITLLKQKTITLHGVMVSFLQLRKEQRQRERYINRIVDEIIDDLDPRLRSLGNCRKVMTPCVEKVLSYAEVVCSRLPGPVMFDRKASRDNPTVRALFANHKKMTEVFSQCKELQDFFRAHPAADKAYMVLGMRKNETQVFGMEQQGDIIKRDVLQKNVSFDDYRISHPSWDEESLRFNLRERALHECVAQTLKHLINTQTYTSELEEQQLKLKMQLSMLENQEGGLEPLMRDDRSLLQRINDIKKKLQEVEKRQSLVSRDMATLDDYLKKAATLLKQPSDLLNVEGIKLCTDRLNRVIEDNNVDKESCINLAQITFSGVEKRVGVLAVFPRNELVNPKSKSVYAL